MDKISVVIPVYNVERYLKQCLDSILTQTYTNLEIIIVDDKSPDKCPEIIDEYAKQDSRVKVIHNEENKGYAKSVNNGIKNSTGDYIAIIESDDFIDKEMFFKTSTSFFLEKYVLFKEEIVRRFSIKNSPNLKYVSYKKMRIK